ncbi:MAG: FKBP-type peptidyl-prolyl cis-trans isomerase [Crocinitomicaceae bacterium]|nr:FKBP-type peptidyl-prolyl cis-trans isomerase [Crocinitomicaceae bacterium]MDG1777362.1 FKBP-type peptidyl-prolyl cis-trans isomerase [Crocinitomicaceae bacterium]
MRCFVLFAVILFFTSCGDDPIKVRPELDWSQEDSTNLNKELAIEEQLDIRLFLEQHKDWELTTTGSGLQYYIYEHGAVDAVCSPKPGDIAEIEYVVRLLDGTVCYQTADDEYEEFNVDNSQIESGVQEGIKKMNIGDRAKLIIPSHLGHGLIGDMDKIPPLNTLIVDVYLIGIQL